MEVDIVERISIPPPKKDSLVDLLTKLMHHEGLESFDQTLIQARVRYLNETDPGHEHH